MKYLLRTGLLAFAFGLMLIGVDTANAQNRNREARREYRDDVRDARREYREDLREGKSRRKAMREYREEMRDARRDYRRDTRRYNYNRLYRNPSLRIRIW